MELEYYIVDSETPESDWETLLDLMNERSEHVSHPDPSSLQGRGRKVAEELGIDEYKEGDFGIYTLEDREEVYYAVSEDGWHIIGESKTLDRFIPEIYRVWTQKGELDI